MVTDTSHLTLHERIQLLPLVERVTIECDGKEHETNKALKRGMFHSIVAIHTKPPMIAEGYFQLTVNGINPGRAIVQDENHGITVYRWIGGDEPVSLRLPDTATRPEFVVEVRIGLLNPRRRKPRVV